MFFFYVCNTDVRTNPPRVLLDKVELLSGVDGQQVSSHHLAGQRDAVPAERLLHQEVLGAAVEHPRLAVCGGKDRDHKVNEPI